MLQKDSYYIMQSAMQPNGAKSQHAGEYKKQSDAIAAYNAINWDMNLSGIVWSKKITLYQRIRTGTTIDRITLASRDIA